MTFNIEVYNVTHICNEKNVLALIKEQFSNIKTAKSLILSEFMFNVRQVELT